MMIIKKLKEILKHNKYKCFLVFLVVYGFSFILFLNNIYTSDHVNAFFIPENIGNIKDYLAGGRFVNLIIDVFYYVIAFLGITHTYNQWVLQGILIIFIALASMELYNLFNEDTKHELLDYKLIGLIIISFINPFFIESFVYKGAELGVAIWITVLSVKYFRDKKYIRSFILLFISISTYQAYIALFLIYATGVWFFQCQKKIDKIMIWDYCKMVFLALLAGILNILIVKLAVKTQVIEAEVKTTVLNFTNENGLISGIIEKILKVWKVCKDVLKTTWNMLPEGFYLSVVLSVILLVLIYLFLRNRKLICLYIFSIVVIHAYPFAIGMVMGTVYLPQRVIWPIFASCSMGLIIAYQILKEHTLFKVYGGIVIIFIGVLFFKTQTCILDIFIANHLDMYYAKSVQEEILEYEEQSGYEVTDVYVIHAHDAEYCHYDFLHMDYTHTYTRKIQAQVWSDVEWLNFVNGENYIKHAIDYNELDIEIKEDTANVFNSSEQLYFERNNLYWVIY